MTRIQPRLRVLVLAALLALAFGVAAFGSPAAAEAPTMRGSGAHACSTWSGERSGGGRAYDAEQWVLGYLSAINVRNSGKGQNLFAQMSDTEIFQHLDAYCGQHPTETLWQALQTMLHVGNGA